LKKTAALSLAVAAAISGHAKGFDPKGSAANAGALSEVSVARAGGFLVRRRVPPFAVRFTIVSSAVR
jgi:hypothetical protein